jgi:hypothetical protein
MRGLRLTLGCFAMALVAQTPNYAPRPADDALARGRAFVDSTEIKDRTLIVTGNTPTPCHQLRIHVPAQPDAAGALAVEVYSVSERGQICAQVLKPFTAALPLSAAQAGSTMTVNGKAAGLPTQ